MNYVFFFIDLWLQSTKHAGHKFIGKNENLYLIVLIEDVYEIKIFLLL